MDELEAAGFEEELAAGAELTEYAQMVESELVENYLQNRLAQAERTAFENNYLITETRRQKLALAQIFLKNIKLQNTVQTKTQSSFWQTILANFQLKNAFAAIAVICVFAVIFILLRSNNQKEPEIVSQQNTIQTPTPANSTDVNVKNQKPQVNSNINPTNISNTNKIKPTATPTPQPIAPAAPTLATFTLFPGTLRSSGEQFVKIPTNTAKATFRLNLPKDAAKYDSYSITIKNSNNETIFTNPTQKSPNLTIPAAKLENDTYIIFLEGNNPQKPSESVAEYTFRVNR